MKKIIQSTLLLALAPVAYSPLYAESLYHLYEKSSVITQNLFQYEHLLTQGQAKEISALLDRIQFVYHLPPENCGDAHTVYKKAYEWAYSYGGLDYSTSKAEAFAENVSHKICPALYLSIHKEAYKYAYSYSGLDKTRSAAATFASMICEYEMHHYYPQSTFPCFKEQYEYAYSYGGLNKTRKKAEEYATEHCIIP